MNILSHIKKLIFGISPVEDLNESPNDKRFTFINDEEKLRIQQVRENMIWYVGDENELLNYYTNQEIYGNYDDPIYNRNRQKYFWGLSSVECNIKRVHSGVPRAMTDIIVSTVGIPDMSSNDKETNDRIREIIDENNLNELFSSIQLPMTLVQGYGAYKINFDKSLSDLPIIQYYKAEDVNFIYKSNILVGIVYKDYYRYDNKNYILLETRSKRNGDSYIEYKLFRQYENDDLKEVPLSTVPDCDGLEDRVIRNLNEVLGVPTKIIYDPQHEEYGSSIFQGKIALFDELDLNRSQNSQTTRVSTPVEYIPGDLLYGGKGQSNGVMKNTFNRQFVKTGGIPDGDGKGSNVSEITTTQPKLDLGQYNENEIAIIKIILMGIISPSTLGLSNGDSDKSSATSAKEKEKVTIMTRNKIINRTSKQLKKLLQLCLIVEDVMGRENAISKGIDVKNEIKVEKGDENGKKSYEFDNYRDVEVTFSEFADPSFESKIASLGPSWRDGEISTEKYVLILWGDKLSQEDREREVKWLDEYRKSRQQLAAQSKNPGLIGGKEETDETSENTDKKVENMGKTVPSENKKSENIKGIKKYNSKK